MASLLYNRPLMSAFTAWITAQILKVVIIFITTKKLQKSMLVSAGGMPSSHSAGTVALAVSIGIINGFHSHLFAVAAVFCIIVMYDAAGVRRAAGKQAAVINMIINILENQDIKLEENLKELLGHTPTQVIAGAVLGACIGAAVS